MDEPTENEPVFYDSSHHRALIVRWIIACAVFALVSWVGLFWFSIFMLGKLTGPEIDGAAASPYEVEAMAGVSEPGFLSKYLACADDDDADGPPPELQADIVLRSGTAGLLSALSRQCLGQNAIYTEWFRVDVSAGRVTKAVPDYTTETMLRSGLGTAGRDVNLKAIVELPLSVLPGIKGLEDPEIRQSIVAGLTGIAANRGYREICIRPRRFNSWHMDGLKTLLAELQPNLSAARARTCLIAEVDSPFWRDRDFVETVDTVLLLAFRTPESGSPPLWLAPSGWFEELVSEALDISGPDKLRVALGAFGYLWRDGKEPEEIAFAEAMRLAALNGGRIEFPEDIENSRVAFPASGERNGEIRLLDAASLWNQLVALRELGADKIALWSAGLEDPAVWQLLNRRNSEFQAANVEDVTLDDYVGYDGAGPFIRLTSPAAAGQREFVRDVETNRIVGQVYTRIPRPVSLERFGKENGKLVALSFDDGPDGSFTREILDVLREKQAPATFFVIGRNVTREPELVRRMVDEGHEVGSHTFFHPDTSEIGALRLSFEVNTVQRLLGGVIGRGTRLFRSPYEQSEGPETAREAKPSIHLLSEGYFVVGSDIVPRDWEGLSADGIVDHVLEESRRTTGSKVIVMHDAGGERSATVAAVPRVIDALRADGYSFVPLATLLGLKRDDLMPPGRDAMTWFDQVTFSLMSGIGGVVIWIFWLAVLGGALRAGLILLLAHLRRPHPTEGDTWPSVTIAISAFNEAASIETAISTALASDYPDLSVVVIDDGSDDGTGDIVEKAYGNDPRVTLIRQKNQGKWKALDTAYRYIESEVVVAVDADTRLQPDAVRLLAANFRDPQVGAVAGNVKVRNRKGILPRLQSLEYITAQNIDRRAAELLNAILVVPGAIGGWRTEAVRVAGLYTANTITEDADLTVSVLRAGYRVTFEPRAVSHTNVPESGGAFLRQRLRWTFGMMQTAWKHRGAFSEGRAVGIVAIPDLWFAGVLLGLLAPIADLVLLGILVDFLIDLALGHSISWSGMPLAMLGSYLALPAIDLLALLAALRFERTEPLSLVLMVPLQRLIYRPLLYVTVYRAFARAIRGERTTWGRPARKKKNSAPETPTL